MFEVNKAIARRYYEECWNKGHRDVVDQLVALNCRFHDAVFPHLGSGPDSLRRHIEMCRTAFPDLHFAIDNMIAEHDEVVVHWTRTGTHERQFIGLPPTRRKTSVTGTSIFRIANGKIVEQWADWNLVMLLEQLGVAQEQYVKVAAG